MPRSSRSITARCSDRLVDRGQRGMCQGAATDSKWCHSRHPEEGSGGGWQPTIQCSSSHRTQHEQEWGLGGLDQFRIDYPEPWEMELLQPFTEPMHSNTWYQEGVEGRGNMLEVNPDEVILSMRTAAAQAAADNSVWRALIRGMSDREASQQVEQCLLHHEDDLSAQEFWDIFKLADGGSAISQELNSSAAGAVHCGREHQLEGVNQLRRNFGSELIGLAGEVFVLEYFQRVLPCFSACNWVSRARDHLLTAGGMRKFVTDPPFDFMYSDPAGVLGGDPGATCLIEVKASGRVDENRFSMTTRQWRLAVSVDRQQRERRHRRQQQHVQVHQVRGVPSRWQWVYVLIRVTGVLAAAPRVEWAVRDLPGLCRTGVQVH
jgi:hypothetical protein